MPSPVAVYVPPVSVPFTRFAKLGPSIPKNEPPVPDTLTVPWLTNGARMKLLPAVPAMVPWLSRVTAPRSTPVPDTSPVSVPMLMSVPLLSTTPPCCTARSSPLRLSAPAIASVAPALFSVTGPTANVSPLAMVTV